MSGGGGENRAALAARRDDETVWTTFLRQRYHTVKSCACGSKTPHPIPMRRADALADGLTPCGVCSRPERAALLDPTPEQDTP